MDEVSWLPTAPFLTDSKPLIIHHAEPDALFGDVSDLRRGSEVRQYKCVADLPDMFSAFSEEWCRRWVRPDHLAANRWEAVLATFPSCPMAYPPLSVRAWREAVKTRPRGACGSDGVSREDLLALPSHLMRRVLLLYQEAERSGRWPIQMVTGIITAWQRPLTPTDDGAFIVLPGLELGQGQAGLEAP